MAIYKLSEFCNYLKGQIEKKENSFIQKYPIISAGVNIKGYYSKYNRDGKYICISTSGASTGHVTYYEGKFWASDCLTLELNNLSMLKSNFFKFLLFKSEKLFKQLKTGSAQQHIYWKDIKNISFDIPSLKEQQKIIDIIEPQKHLFEKYHNCIRIDSFENTKKDLQKIIDIIEPLNKIQNKTKKIRQLLKKYLLNQYISNNNPYINLDKIIKIHNLKRQNQLDYLPTAAVSELTYDSVNKIDLELEEKSLSRADLTVVPNSIIVSKLLGENKVLPITKIETKYVYSTGFFNFTSENNNHLLMYFLSNHFIKQKKIFATGTTMLAITKDTLKCFQIKKPLSKIIKVNLIKVFSLLNNIEIYLNKTKQLFLRLLIK